LQRQAPGDEHPAVSGIDEDESLLAELATAYASRSITMVEWMTARKPIEERLAVARKKIHRANRQSLLPVTEDGESIRKRWVGLDLDRKRAIISTLLDHAVVHPVQFKGRREFDPSRIEPVWLV
jgi:hypothetical protein